MGNGWSASGRPFHQVIQVPVPHKLDDLMRLELYQAYPHDPFSTLCMGHLLRLARWWHRRRSGAPELEHELAAAAAADGINPADLDGAAGAGVDPDQPSLRTAKHAEEWRRRDTDHLMRVLERAINHAAHRLREARRATILRTGQPPRCGLGYQGGVLLCVLCAAAEGVGGLRGLLPTMRDRILAGDHGALAPDETALFEEAHRARGDSLFEPGCGHRASSISGEGRHGDDGLVILCHVCGHRRPIDLWRGSRSDPLPQHGLSRDADAAYVSVGGLHLVVDICEGITLIKFQSTIFSTVHERGKIGRDRANPVSTSLADEIGAFEPTVCSAGRRICACRPSGLLF
ncbi:uncharacterized protein HRG_09011 [Hirsutella rhossiliensis]|uniref:Uncharacterized protein n=1 Tax=Hirsutella rhossiliensis TaxID=111463 RepID=A0A9P8SG19_9HYPO|nr:uncharacterized protein HRG_09011 [Hirsutella rhossiliensis]KAH0959990.1 hypothetical protein HRG_09011 [Hirsutella rhossiliensis]